jgi:hypothetical protein
LFIFTFHLGLFLCVHNYSPTCFFLGRGALSPRGFTTSIKSGQHWGKIQGEGKAEKTEVLESGGNFPQYPVLDGVFLVNWSRYNLRKILII